MSTEKEQQERSEDSVAIIGAGLAGLACARQLSAAGMKVEVLEKSRGVGGRMATRRADPFQFDHGTQYFTVRDPRFQDFIDGMITEGAVQPWNPRIVILRHGQIDMEEEPKSRYVGVPSMNGICRNLAEGLQIRRNTRVVRPERRLDGWHLHDDRGQFLGTYDVLLISAPAPQAAALLPFDPTLSGHAHSARMLGCWAGMFAFAQSLPLEFDGAFLVDSPLNWIARDSSKPERNAEHNTWVVHASSEWSAANIEGNAREVMPQLFAAFFEACGLEPCLAVYASAHRWRYALAAGSLAAGCFFDDHRRVGVCGDWCQEPRVEGAYLSGLALAKRVLDLAASTCSDSDT
jgi:renalase